MSTLDELIADELSATSVCKYAQVIEELGDDAAKLDPLSASAAERVLKRAGLSVSDSVIRVHRHGQCCCG